MTPTDPARTSGDAAMDVVHLLRKISFAYADRVASGEAQAGLHATDLRALVEMLDAERQGRTLHAGDLARRLGMSTQATTALLKRLDARGLVARRRSPTDARRVELLASAEALEVGRRHFGAVVERLAGVAAGLAESDRLVVEGFLEDALASLTGGSDY